MNFISNKCNVSGGHRTSRKICTHDLRIEVTHIFAVCKDIFSHCQISSLSSLFFANFGIWLSSSSLELFAIEGAWHREDKYSAIGIFDFDRGTKHFVRFAIFGNKLWSLLNSEVSSPLSYNEYQSTWRIITLVHVSVLTRSTYAAIAILKPNRDLCWLM